MKAAWSRVKVAGSLAAYVGSFAEDLAVKGYAESTVAEHVRLIAQLSRWMISQSLGTDDLTTARVEQFVQVRTDRLAHRPHEPILDYLRRMRLVPQPAPPEPTVSVVDGLRGRLDSDGAGDGSTNRSELASQRASACSGCAAGRAVGGKV